MIQKAHQHNNISGFTLVELSVALVVIGLIAGGILVGADMIKASELRGTIAQVEKYNSAVNTFRVKYNALPGDILQSYAQAYGLFTLSAGISNGLGDGSGLLEGGAAGITAPAGETLVFWRHLSDASLVEGSFGVNGNGAIVAATGLVTANNVSVDNSLPPSKVKPRQYFVVYSESGFNYYQLLPVSQVSTPAAYSFSSFGLTPQQAFNMDQKLDDGSPNSGVVMARSITSVNAVSSWLSTSTADTCLSNGANATDPAAIYNRVSSTGGNDLSCSVRFRFN
jgi:prepilin-type N-terminal cleavage/methylation domain-containing protein